MVKRVLTWKNGQMETIALPGTQFRWKFYDDCVGEDWTKWHSVDGDCAGCCCSGPHGGEHQHPASYRDEDGYLWGYNHTSLDPRDTDELDTVEWRTSAQ